MRTTLDRITLDAKTRLNLPAGASPSKEVARYRQYLRLGMHRLKMVHRHGESGRGVCQGRSLLLDLLLTNLLTAYEASRDLSARKPIRFSLIAIGGYGRGELNPCSDIDIMFLHNASRDSESASLPFMELLTGGLLWDIGLKVGHSVRTVDDCVRVANSDMQSKTSLLEARCIHGDEELFQQMQKAVLAKCVAGREEEYIEARIEDQEARRLKFGSSACMQEPNVKNGSGGLRDFQNLLWMAFVKYRSRTLADLEERKLISATERLQLEEAYDFLLRVRTELHFHLNRPADLLTKSVQPAIARNLGYTERSPSERIERFMRDYYMRARNLSLITRTLEQRLALLPQPKRLPSLKQFLRQRRQNASYTLDGFKFVDGQVFADSENVFRDQPQRLMRAFRHAQQRGLELHPDLAQIIRNNLSLVDSRFRADANIQETFLEILNQRGNVAPILRAMHDTGLLGAYIPAFGKLTCLVQHEFYHQYTADEHTLRCIEKLDEIWGAQDPPLGQYADLLHKLERPNLLYLALLLHDAGKATHKPDHADHSSRIALSLAKRLQMDPTTTRTLCLLVKLHLEMILVSQRRDLDDLGVIRAFAQKVQSQEALRMLTLVTYADSVGTSDQLWNGFKDTLLWALYHKTDQVLSGGTDFIRAEERQRELLAEQVSDLMPSTFREDELRGHFTRLPARYFQLRSAKEIFTDLALAHRFMHRQLSEDENALVPLVAWHHEPNRGYSQVKICTWDRPGLFSRVAGALTAAGLNILNAEIFTRDDNIVLDTFLVVDAVSGLLANREERERFEQILADTLAGDLSLTELLRRRKNPTPLYRSHEGERMPTVVRFDNLTSEAWSIIDLETEDRVGLLHAVSQLLAEMSINVALAKICTEKGAAMDSFFVCDLTGQKILDPKRLKQIEDRLRKTVKSLD